MKLLGWMHRKFRQNNSSEQLKDIGIGQPSVDDQECYQKPSYGNKPFRQSSRDNLRKSFAGLEAARIEEEFYEEESSAISELFHGFLAIGTLGSDTAITDPATPTFAISVENITEKETEVTENELKLINDELEKVLIAEANKEDGCNLSSGRNSHVSTGRSSHGSTITLSGKTLEVPESNRNSSSVCPLQGYLFGSAIELSETTTTVATKKEHRTSLGELFQRTKMAEENPGGGKFDREEKRIDNKEADKSAVYLMKKMLKKKLMLHASKGFGAASADSSSPENKLHKILHMFHRKVHPESSAAATQKQNKHQKYETKKNNSNDAGGPNNSSNNGGGQVLQNEDIMALPSRALIKERIRRYKSQSNPLQFTLAGSESNGNREHWIKTDADYLVLEL